jgi:dienelactone hydrolase
MTALAAAVQRIRAGKAKKGEAILGAPAAYWDDMSASVARAVKALPAIQGRVLVLGGGRDYQSTRADFDTYAAALKAHPRAKLEWFANLNHLFMPGKKKATPADYEKAGHVDPRVINLIADWVQSADGG